MNAAHAFLLSVVLLSWICWSAAALAAGTAATVLYLLGGAMPSAVLIFVLSRDRPRGARADFLRRVRDPRPWRSPAMAAALLLPWALALAGRFVHGEAKAAIEIGTVAALALPMLVFGPLVEELAWRGHAQPLLMQRMTPLTSSALIALAWSAWHLPLFFIDGTYQHGIGLLSFGGALFFANLAAQSVLMTVLLLRSSLSPWSAVLFHWSTNWAGESLQLSADAEVWRSAFTLALAALAAVLRAPWGLRAARLPV